MSTITGYLTDDQITRIMLPLINEALDNIQKYPKAIVGFARFSSITRGRYSGKTLAVMHLPRLMRMCYSDELQGNELDEARAACNELFTQIDLDIKNRVNGGSSQQQSYN